MMMKKVPIIACALLVGCASPAALNRAMTYKNKPVQVSMQDDTYRVFEHPTEKMLMTTPSLGASATIGVVRGATLGITPISVLTPEQKHEAAAQRYLDQTGRPQCRITKGYMLVDPQYEFSYECTEPAAAPPKPE